MSSVDDMKLARDGQLTWGRKVERPAPKPPMWWVERDEDGMPARMYWTGYDRHGVHYTERMHELDAAVAPREGRTEP